MTTSRPDFARVKYELREFLRERHVVLTTSMYDNLQLWERKDPDDDPIEAFVEDKINSEDQRQDGM